MSALLTTCFFACSIVIWWNVHQIVKDKGFYGVSLFPSVVFIITAVVQVIYFAMLGDLWNVAGSASIVLANAVWLGLALHYRRYALYYL